MYHSDDNNYLRPFEGRTYESYRTPQQEANRQRANGQFLDALVRLLWWMWKGGPILLAGKAGYNWYELTKDGGAAAERGAQALARWKWFQIGTIITTFFVWRAGYFQSPIMAWTVLFWLVLYVRLAEFSLFRRGPVQWAMTPLSRILDPVHSWAIILVAFLPVPMVVVLHANTL